MDMIIRNGTVVSATGSYKADVAVKDGKIAAVGSIPDIPGAIQWWTQRASWCSRAL